jgi:hypothetical protein
MKEFDFRRASAVDCQHRENEEMRLAAAIAVEPPGSQAA